MKKRLSLLLALLLAALCLSGCGVNAKKSDISTLQSQIDQLTIAVHQLQQQNAALESKIGALTSSQPVSASAASDALYSLSAEVVCKNLQALGLPISGYTTYDASSDPNGLLGKEGAYTSKTNFTDSRVSGTNGVGFIEAFPDVVSAQSRENYFINVVQVGGSVQTPPILYRYGNILLRFGADFSQEQAAEYDAGMKRLLGLAG